MFDKLKKLLGKKEEPKKAEAPKVRKPRKTKEVKVELSAKDKATQAGEPYVNILSMELDPENVQSGSFELDWNSLFITQLVKAGYMKKKTDTDQDIVDRWFEDVCRNVALQMYEQSIADPENRSDMRTIRNKDIGEGRTEVS